MARTGSPFAYALDAYQNWSGRFIAFLLMGVTYSWPGLHGVMSVVPPIAFAALPAAVVGGLRRFGVPIRVDLGIALTIVAFAASWVALAPYLAECVFWLNGGVCYAGA